MWPRIIDSLSATSVDENGTVHLTGTYHDVGSQDTHELTIDWGEGFSETYAVSGGSFDIEHQYLDDNPSGTSSDVYTISATLSDDDTGSDSEAVDVTISNVEPILVLDPVADIDENGIATLTGTITDPGTLDTFTLVINWGDLRRPTTTRPTRLPQRDRQPDLHTDTPVSRRQPIGHFERQRIPSRLQSRMMIQPTPPGLS